MKIWTGVKWSEVGKEVKAPLSIGVDGQAT